MPVWHNNMMSSHAAVHAVQFEWAWQNPRKSRLLREHPTVKKLRVKDECLLPGKIKVRHQRSMDCTARGCAITRASGDYTDAHLIPSACNARAQVVSAMLTTPPWSRLPLTIHWLSEAHTPLYPADPALPRHVKVRHGDWRWRPSDGMIMARPLGNA
jgi:hypothetical protein